jgi:hypothetical protein
MDWKSAVQQKVQEEVKAERGLSIARMVEMAGLSRASFYRCGADQPLRPEPDLDLRDAIQRIALEFPCYGWLRVRIELTHRGWRVNHRRVRRIMRADNLLCLRKRKFVVTTNSNHARTVYENLAA